MPAPGELCSGPNPPTHIQESGYAFSSAEHAEVVTDGEIKRK
jgi:hypothetical protein